ncbi:MAG: hypothetical protein ACIAXF_10470 [Phycisphaerales bacterium JB063]
MKLNPKRLLTSAAFIAFFCIVGAVGGVLYPYTELFFNNDLSQRQRERHTDTAMTDDGDKVKRRAMWGAIYLGGLSTLVLAMQAARKPDDT